MSEWGSQHKDRKAAMDALEMALSHVRETP